MKVQNCMYHLPVTRILVTVAPNGVNLTGFLHSLPICHSRAGGNLFLPNAMLVQGWISAFTGIAFYLILWWRDLKERYFLLS